MRIVINEYVEFEFYIHLTTWYINTKNWFTPYEVRDDLTKGIEKKLFCFTWQTHTLLADKYNVFEKTLAEPIDFVFDEPKRRFKAKPKELALT